MQKTVSIGIIEYRDISFYIKNITINKLCTWKNNCIKNIKILMKFLKHTFYKHMSWDKYMLLTIL